MVSLRKNRVNLALGVCLIIGLVVGMAGCMPGDIDESVYVPNVYNNTSHSGSVGSASSPWLNGYFDNINGSPVVGALSGVVFTQIADKTIDNTIIESSLIGVGSGYGLTFPTNFFSVGKTVHIQLRGYFSSTGNPTGNIKVNMGSTTIATLGASAVGANVINHEFLIWYQFTYRTIGNPGTAIGQGEVTFYSDHGTSTMYDLEATGTTNVDTTAANILDVLWTWGTADASNTITSTNAVVEVLN